MPISLGFLRTDGQPHSVSQKVYIPLYSVLFWYGNDADFANTTSGTLNFDYYRSYIELYEPAITFYNTDGSPSPLKCDPLISCVSSDSNWTSNTGYAIAPSTSMPTTAGTLFDINTHNPSKLTRTKIYNALGISVLDNPSSVYTYPVQSADYTHNHIANNIAFNLTNIKYGSYDGLLQTTSGINAIAVKPILRDPQIVTNEGEVYTEHKLFVLPKNVIVFGKNLPNTYFTQQDVYHSNPATGSVLPLMCKKENVGALNIANTLSFSIPTNTVNNHNHNLFSSPKSDKSNQTGYSLVDAGSHLHQVEYTNNVTLRSKILKAWITTSDDTPIANGVILGYSLGKTSLYNGVYSNSAILPVNWHFCDGNNGTPDLRGYFIYANFDSSNNCHDTVYHASNTITISSITMQANGNHSHIGPLTGVDVNYGTPVDIGAHSFEDSLNHVHSISTIDNFKYSVSDNNSVLNIKEGLSFQYSPPQAQLAFIMYNENIA